MFVLVVVIPLDIWVVVLALGWKFELDPLDTFTELVDVDEEFELVELEDEFKLLELRLLAGMLLSPLGLLLIPVATPPTPPDTLGVLAANE